MQAPAEGKAELNLLEPHAFSAASPSICLIGSSVRAAAESAKRAGYNVFSVDHFGDRDTLAVSKQHLPLPNFCKTSPQQDGAFQAQLADWTRVLPTIFVGGVRFSSQLLTHLPLSDHDQHLIAFSKQLQRFDCLRAACKAEGIHFPETRSLASAEFSIATLEARSELETNSWLLKQPDHCGGLGVRWLNANLVNRFPSLPSGSVFQRWIPGRLFGTSLLSNGTEVAILGTCRGRFTRLGDLPFVYSGSCGPVPLTSDLKNAILRLSESLVRRTGFRGIFNLDWVMTTSAQPSVLEVNPRWSGSVELLERAWLAWHQRSNVEAPFRSIMDWVIRAIQGEQLPSCLSLEGKQASLPPNRVLAQDDDSTVDEPIWVKRIIFSRREQVFDADAVLKMRILSGVSLHDLPLNPVTAQYGEPLCTMVFPWSQNDGLAQKRRYQTCVRTLSHGV